MKMERILKSKDWAGYLKSYKQTMSFMTADPEVKVPLNPVIRCGYIDALVNSDPAGSELSSALELISLERWITGDRARAYHQEKLVEAVTSLLDRKNDPETVPSQIITCLGRYLTFGYPGVPDVKRTMHKLLVLVQTTTDNPPTLSALDEALQCYEQPKGEWSAFVALLRCNKRQGDLIIRSTRENILKESGPLEKNKKADF